MADFAASDAASDAAKSDAIASLVASKLHARTRRLARTFVKYDTHRTGRLSRADLRRALAHVGVALADDELRALVMKFDRAGDGTFATSALFTLFAKYF